MTKLRALALTQSLSRGDAYEKFKNKSAGN